MIIPIRITALTGLHIGTSNDDYEIGGMDNPVIKYFRENDYNEKGSYPYIPGSSLKGKMRSLMEWAEGEISKDGKTHICFEVDCPICRIFGGSAAEAKGADKEEKKRKARLRGPGRLIVRDCFPTQETRAFMEYLEESEGLPKVEVKHENSINRLTAEANPRPQERVPVGSKFVGELVYSVYKIDIKENEKENTDEKENEDLMNGEMDIEHISKVIQALQLVEDSYLGGGGTRGSGKVKIELASINEIKIRTPADYKTMGKQTEQNNSNKTEDPENSANWQSLDGFDVDEIKKRIRERIAEANDDNKDDNGISNA
ncbi:type III-A CRISPR-associated RAMP protein Csm3 [bacterium]|nr:type III-A CRISPR-associated RAMP protein Csm3 [bacterium]